MIKKKLNILLLLLLVVLFTSLLGTISYAKQYKLTYEDIVTITNRWPLSVRGGASTATNNWRLWVKVRDYQEIYDTVAFYIFGNSTNMFCNVYGFNKSQVTGVTNISNLNYASIQITGTAKKFDVTNYIESDVTNISLGSGAQLSTQYHIWTNNLGSFADGPQDMPNVLTFPPNETFTYARSELNNLINLNGSYAFSNQAEEILFVYDPFSGDQVNEADGVITGYLWDADQFDYAIFSTYKYDYATKQFRYSGDTWYSRDIGTIHDNMIWVEFKASDYGTKLVPDSLIHAEFIPKSNNFDHIHCDFYVRSPYTNIVNGVLQVDGTFSGDYGLIYNDNINTDKVIGSLTDEQQEQQSLNDLDSLFSGDINDLADNFGFVDLADPAIGGLFPSNIYNRLVEYMNDITDVLLEEQPQTFTFYLHDQTGQVVLNTNDFITPNGPLKVFMQLFLITCTIFVVWHQFYRYYELLSTFNVVLLMHDLDVEKTVFRM